MVDAHLATSSGGCPRGWGQHHPQSLQCQATAPCLQFCFVTQKHSALPHHLPSRTCKTSEDAKGHFCFLHFLSLSQSLMLRNAIRKKKKNPITALKSSTLNQGNRFSKIKSTQKSVILSKSTGYMHMECPQLGIKPAQCRDRILFCLSSGL